MGTLKKIAGVINKLTDSDIDIDNTMHISLDDGSTIDLTIEPDLDGDGAPLESWKADVKWEKEFEDDDVVIEVNVGIQNLTLTSPAGTTDFSASFTAVKRF